MLNRWKVWSAATAATLLAVLAAMPAQADPNQYFPDNPEFVISFNMRQILTSDLFKKNKELETLLRQGWESQTRKNEEVQAILKALGFDLFRDINSISIAGQVEKKPKNLVVVIDGRFKKANWANVARKYAKQKPKEMRVHRAGAHIYFEITPPNKNESGFVAVPSNKTILFTSSQQAMKTALSRGLRRAKIGADLKKLLSKTSTKKQSFFFVVGKKGLEKGAAMGGGGGGQLPFDVKDLNGLRLSITASKDVSLRADAITKNAAVAKKVNQLASKGLQTMKEKAGDAVDNNPLLQPLADIADTFKTNVRGSTVSVTGRVPQSAIKLGLKLVSIFGP